MYTQAESGYTIGTLAAATGVAVATLRAWEARFGFPTPDRSPAGHRRYCEEDRARIEEVVRLRGSGLSLDAAIARTRQADLLGAAPESVFAHLRAGHPELDVHVLSRRTMLALSGAFEDECCARAERPVLVGGFQHEKAFRRSEQRWRELNRTATVGLVLADFKASASPPGGPVEVRLPTSSPLRREWLIICDAPNVAACLVGWERPQQPPAELGPRPFEAVWSVEPPIVRDATRAALALGAKLAPEHLEGPALDDMHEPADPAVVLRRAASLMNRIVAYLQPPAPR